MENEPPGFFPVPRGDLGDPQILRICYFSSGFKFYGNLGGFKAVVSIGSWSHCWLSLSLIVIFFKLRDQRNPDGPRLPVVIGEDSCFFCLLVCAFTIMVPTQSGPLRSGGKSGPVEHWSGTALLSVSLYQVSTAEARWKPLMTAWWLAAGLQLQFHFIFPLFFPSAQLSVKNMFPVV